MSTRSFNSPGEVPAFLRWCLKVPGQVLAWGWTHGHDPLQMQLVSFDWCNICFQNVGTVCKQPAVRLTAVQSTFKTQRSNCCIIPVLNNNCSSYGYHKVCVSRFSYQDHGNALRITCRWLTFYCYITHTTDVCSVSRESNDAVNTSPIRPYSLRSDVTHLVTAIINQNEILQEVKSRLNSGSSCYHSRHSVLASPVLSASLDYNFTCWFVWKERGLGWVCLKTVDLRGTK
jgi:hypothetical protein